MISELYVYVSIEREKYLLQWDISNMNGLSLL